MPETRTPRQAFHEICHREGRMKKWVAEKAGMTLPQLSNKFAGRYGYAWQPGEREAVAECLGVELSAIWPEEQGAREGETAA
jgi:lambda repressor-like predicted transcriptional regulator